MADYGAIPATRPSQAKNMRLPVLALACLAAVALSAVVVLSQRGSAVSLSQYPKSDIGMLKVMQSMATAPAKAAPVAAAPKAHGKGDLSMPQQYARIMQNLGYFAPWSRQNSWADRVAVNNIRKANTPSALARKQSQIAAENARFARKFATPHTSQYTGEHLSQDQILDPKYDPWGNTGPRKAYYQGF
mmetsp:Transcript_39515/g.90094  ORF Transcript_39515/g.90094 Transcript_39515/m.90094 type:complete len:188 (+) Transcript_39515:22-585(+)